MPLLFLPRKLCPNSTQVCFGDRRRRVAEQKRITCFSLDIHTSQLAHYIRRQSVRSLSALQVASATFKNKEVLENVFNWTLESRQNLQTNTSISILLRIDSAFTADIRLLFTNPSHCFSLSFVIQNRDMHKYKQFRTLRHVVLSNLCADVNFGWCFFLVQCVLLKRFTITIRERKENSGFFFVRAASYSSGKEFILFLFIKKWSGNCFKNGSTGAPGGFGPLLSWLITGHFQVA